MYRNVVTEMSPDRNGQTESARPKSPVPRWYMFYMLWSQILAKKQSSFEVFFVTQWGHRYCLATIAFIPDISLVWLNMYCDGPTTITWNSNVFSNDFPWSCRRVKKQLCQVIRVQPVHSLKVLQRSSDFDCYPILSKFEII